MGVLGDASARASDGYVGVLREEPARGARPTMYCSLRVSSSWQAVAIANLSIPSEPTEISDLG